MNTTGMQSSLHAAPGSGAALIQELGLVLYVGAAAIFVVVIVLLVRAVFTGPRAIDERRWIIGGGIALPVFVLSGLLVYALAVGSAVAEMDTRGLLRIALDCISSGARALSSSPQSQAMLRVEVVAKQWWWEVRYQETGEDAASVVLANELHVPRYRPVEVVLRSDDVIHSFWVPSLAGKVDMIPGRTNRVVIQAGKNGTYRGQCAEYCGGQHALMGFYVVVHSAADFQAWLQQQARPAVAPTDEFLKLGREVFMRGDCGECHTVRGTAADGVDGPDLTHVGSRRSLAAGVLDNHVGTMAGWIAGAQDVKRGNHMPSMNIYAGHELRALSAWLMSLE